MASNKELMYIGFFLITLVSTGVFYVNLNNSVKYRIDNDKDTIYVKNDNDRFIVAGRAWLSIWDWPFKMNRRVSEITNETIIEGDIITRIRTTPYIRGPTIKQISKFDSSLNDITSVPFDTRIEVYNGTGHFFRYEVRELSYDGPTKSLNGTSMEFGNNIKVEWQEGYRWAKVYKSGILKVQYDIKSDFEVFKVRLSDPPLIEKIEECHMVQEDTVEDVMKEFHNEIAIMEPFLANTTYGILENGKNVTKYNFYNSTRWVGVNKVPFQKKVGEKIVKKPKEICTTIGIKRGHLTILCPDNFRCEVKGEMLCYVSELDGDPNYPYSDMKNKGGWTGDCKPI